MKTQFDEIIEEVLEAEGGFVHDPDDKGGATNHGVTQQSYSEFLGRKATVEEVKNMTVEDAKECYKKDFWIPAKVDRIPDNLKHIYFDMVVNMGRRNAGKILQQAVNTKKNITVLEDITFQTYSHSDVFWFWRPIFQKKSLLAIPNHYWRK